MRELQLSAWIKRILVALINTFIENYELELVKLQVNGEDVKSDLIEADENGYSTYFEDYEEITTE